MKYGGLFRIALLFVVVYFTAGVAFSDEIKDEKEWVRGGVVVGIKNDGSCRLKLFTKVGITEDNPDDGKAQILGFEPGNVQVSRKGDVIWERVYDDLFIQAGHARAVHGRLCKCNAY